MIDDCDQDPMMTNVRYSRRNWRDLGGWNVPSGMVKTGCLYRSAHLDRLTIAEVDFLTRLGIAYAVDLRHEVEKAPAGDRVEAIVPGISCFELSLSDAIDEKTLPLIAEDLANMKCAAEAYAWMCEQYVCTIMRRRKEILDVLRFLMTRDRPAVFYCVAGKDRTGVIAALLLAVLGVSRKDILRDYDKTNKRLWGLPFLRVKERAAEAQYGLQGVKKTIIDALDEANPKYLVAAFDAWDRAGGTEAYLEGLDSKLLDDFRARLIA
jgi:protein-tyrosine phosphatase